VIPHHPKLTTAKPIIQTNCIFPVPPSPLVTSPNTKPLTNSGPRRHPSPAKLYKAAIRSAVASSLSVTSAKEGVSISCVPHARAPEALSKTSSPNGEVMRWVMRLYVRWYAFRKGMTIVRWRATRIFCFFVFLLLDDDDDGDDGGGDSVLLWLEMEMEICGVAVYAPVTLLITKVLMR